MKSLGGNSPRCGARMTPWLKALCWAVGGIVIGPLLWLALLVLPKAAEESAAALVIYKRAERNQMNFGL